MTTILIADDHHFFRTGVTTMLSAAGFEVVGSVQDGDAALTAIGEVDPNVVILDIRMPGRDGVATLEAMRKKGDNRPVIVLATEVSDSQLVAIMRAGVNAILFKDGAEELLLETIEAVRDGRRHIDGELIDKAFALATSGSDGSPLSVLSARERQVAEAVARGLRNREVGQALGMTEGTVKVFLHNIYSKLGIGNRTELAILMQPGRTN